MVSDNNDISLDVNLGIDHILDIGNAENIPYPLPPTLLSPSATQLDVCVYAQAYLYNKERNSPFMTPEQALMWLVRFGVGPCRSSGYPCLVLPSLFWDSDHIQRTEALRVIADRHPHYPLTASGTTVAESVDLATVALIAQLYPDNPDPSQTDPTAVPTSPGLIGKNHATRTPADELDTDPDTDPDAEQYRPASITLGDLSLREGNIHVAHQAESSRHVQSTLSAHAWQRTEADFGLDDFTSSANSMGAEIRSEIGDGSDVGGEYGVYTDGPASPRHEEDVGAPVLTATVGVGTLGSGTANEVEQRGVRPAEAVLDRVVERLDLNSAGQNIRLFARTYKSLLPGARRHHPDILALSTAERDELRSELETLLKVVGMNPKLLSTS